LLFGINILSLFSKFSYLVGLNLMNVFILNLSLFGDSALGNDF